MTYAQDPISFRQALHLAILKSIDSRIETAENIRIEIDKQLAFALEFHHLADEEKKELGDVVYQEIVGAGVIDSLLANPKVSEVFVKGAHQVFVKMDGRFHLHKHDLTSNIVLLDILEKFISRAQKRLDETAPFFSELISEWGDVVVLLAPMVKEPTVLIKKQDTVRSVTRATSAPPGPIIDPRAFLRSALEAGVGVLITGYPRSGKTRFLNEIMKSIPSSLRVITIEDRSELNHCHEYGVELYTRPPNMEDEGAIFKVDLLGYAKKFDADVIVMSDLYGDLMEKLVLESPRLQDTMCVATTSFNPQFFNKNFAMGLKEDEKNKRWRELFPIVVELKTISKEPTVNRIYSQTLKDNQPHLDELYAADGTL